MSAFNALFGLATIVWFIGGRYIVGTWDLQFNNTVWAYKPNSFSNIKID